MKRILVLFLALMLCLSYGMAEEEVSFLQATQTPEPALETASPDTTAATETNTNNQTKGKSAARTELLPDGSTQITISAVGDITIGGDVRKAGLSIFDKELKKQNDDLSFVMRNVRHIFAEDTLTIGNFEGTLTKAPVFKKKNEFVFSAPAEYVQILNDGNFELMSFENNHVMDHGPDGHADTIAEFEKAGLLWSTAEHMGVFEVEGIKIAVLAYQTFNLYPELFEKVPLAVQDAKSKYDIVVVSYHWGDEMDYVPNANQQKLGRMTIDAGADLVFGHHSHRINPIEEYKGKYIAYSLGNFSFSGNSKPKDMSTFILQVRFRIKDGTATTAGFRIIPCRISSKSDYNDFAPTPFTEQRLIDNVINVLKSNGRKLEYAVEQYPVDWE